LIQFVVWIFISIVNFEEIEVKKTRDFQEVAVSRFMSTLKAYF